MKDGFYNLLSFFTKFFVALLFSSLLIFLSSITKNKIEKAIPNKSATGAANNTPSSPKASGSNGSKRHGKVPYVKISTNDIGRIKIIGAKQKQYKLDGHENAKLLYRRK